MTLYEHSIEGQITMIKHEDRYLQNEHESMHDHNTEKPK